VNRLSKVVRADDHRFLRGQPARQLAGGSRKRVGLEAEILTNFRLEANSLSGSAGQLPSWLATQKPMVIGADLSHQHLAQPIHERQLLKGERERSLDLHRHVDGGLDIAGCLCWLDLT
jgi:hypothetical protein